MLLSGLKGIFVLLSGVSGTTARHVTKKHFSFPDGFHPGSFHGSADCESIKVLRSTVLIRVKMRETESHHHTSSSVFLLLIGRRILRSRQVPFKILSDFTQVAVFSLRSDTSGDPSLSKSLSKLARKTFILNAI